MIVGEALKIYYYYSCCYYCYIMYPYAVFFNFNADRVTIYVKLAKTYVYVIFYRIKRIIRLRKKKNSVKHTPSDRVLVNIRCVPTSSLLGKKKKKKKSYNRREIQSPSPPPLFSLMQNYPSSPPHLCKHFLCMV